MIENIDDNFGRMMALFEEWRLVDNNDIASDPGETRGVSALHPEVVQQLSVLDLDLT